MHTQKQSMSINLQKTIISTITLTLLSTGIAMAQTVPGDILQKPETQKYTITIGSAEVAKRLEVARDTVWNATLNKNTSPIFSGEDILVSGITSLNGQEVLYIGLNEEAYEKEESYEKRVQELKQFLQAEFPGIPVHIETTEIHFNEENMPEDLKEIAQTTPDIFFEDFENGMGLWNITGDRGHNWKAERLDESQTIEGHERNNKVAQTEDCDNPCILTLKTPIDLTGYTSAHLALHRFVDNALDNKEYLAVEIGNGGTYTEIFRWTPEEDDDDNKWHKETYNLSEYLGSEQFTIRFTSKQSSIFEETAIDNIRITAQEPTVATENTCANSPNRSFPLLGGDRVVMVIETEKQETVLDDKNSCSTIALGGVETNSGKKGFVISAHAAGNNSFEAYRLVAGHTVSQERNRYLLGGPVGKLDRMPYKWNYVVSNDESDEQFIFGNSAKQEGRETIHADAAFIEYPTTTRCEEEWLNVCLKRRYNERVQEKKIRGDNEEIYTVTESEEPEIGMKVRSIGTTTRQERAGEVVSRRLLFSADNTDTHFFAYYATQSPIAQSGDSGSPVYTPPNRRNQVKMVGVFTGNAGYAGEVVGVFSSWQDIEKALDLKSL